MALDLSSNWKRLQVTLKQDPNDTGLKRKPEPTQRQQSSIAKRRRVNANHRGIPVALPGPSRNRVGMGTGASDPEHPEEPAPSTSLALWAEYNDISAKDLADAYELELQDTTIQNTVTDKINAGLSVGVEVGKYVGMDCEMVGVGGDEDRSVLARVSIVNFHGSQVYDSFVRPKEFVTDWRTHISGVSPKNMATARPFDEVRNEISELLKNRILIGHAVKHDLDVMMLTHPKRDIRDTSKFSGFRKYNIGKTPSLKKLAREVLGMEIQQGQHSSIEDARATMLVFRRHKQSFDAEIARIYPQRKITGAETRSEPRSKKKKKKKNKKNKR